MDLVIEWVDGQEQRKWLRKGMEDEIAVKMGTGKTIRCICPLLIELDTNQFLSETIFRYGWTDWCWARAEEQIDAQAHEIRVSFLPLPHPHHSLLEEIQTAAGERATDPLHRTREET